MELGQLTNEIVEKSESSCLVDFQGKGEILLITCGYYHPTGSNFDFYQRLKKLEVLTGRKINKILLRDKKLIWYQQGVEGMGDNIPETVESLKKIIKEISPSKIITLGQSMGGYGAIIFGELLGVDKILTFGARSCLISQKYKEIGDMAWFYAIQEIEKLDIKYRYDDPVEQFKDSGVHLELHYGTAPEDFSLQESVSADVPHNIRLSAIKGAVLFPYQNCGHVIIEYLKEVELIDDILINRIFDLPFDYLLPQKRQDGHPQQLSTWVYDNLKQGCLESQLLETMANEKIEKAQADKALKAARARLVIEQMFK